MIEYRQPVAAFKHGSVEVVINSDGSVFERDEIKSNAPWEESAPIPGTQRDVQKRNGAR